MTDKKTKSLQRVLDVAAQIFAERRFETVSVSEIAERAHCSTATIYDVHGNKENLFLAAMSHALKNSERPRLSTATRGATLESLLAYAEARARWLSSPERRSMTRALSSELSRMKPLIHDMMNNEYALMTRTLTEEVQVCIDTGLLRALDAETITYNIMAGTTYESVVFGLIYGDDTPVDHAEVVRKVFTPLVTAKGARQLEAYLERTPQDVHAAD